MYNYQLHQQITECLQQNELDLAGKDNKFYTRFVANTSSIHALFNELYGHHAKSKEIFSSLIQTIVDGYKK